MILLVLLACQGASPAQRTLTFGAYSAPREVYEDVLLPAFVARWKAQTGEDLVVESTYQASGALVRAVSDGLEADVVATALAPDIDKLVKAGLVDAGWDRGEHHGNVAQTLAVLAVREGNPKRIHSWDDLARGDVEVLTPNARTSGGALWNVAALWGGALRREHQRDDVSAAMELLTGVLGRVAVMDKGARESLLTFEHGVGDVAITYASEVALARRHGRAMEAVVPPATIRIDTPAAVVDAYAVRHGNAEVARALVDFLHGPEAQAAFAAYGFGVDEALAGRPCEVFTMADLGGWSVVRERLFGVDGLYDAALETARERR